MQELTMILRHLNSQAQLVALMFGCFINQRQPYHVWPGEHIVGKTMPSQHGNLTLVVTVEPWTATLQCNGKQVNLVREATWQPLALTTTAEAKDFIAISCAYMRSFSYYSYSSCSSFKKV